MVVNRNLVGAALKKLSLRPHLKKDDTDLSKVYAHPVESNKIVWTLALLLKVVSTVFKDGYDIAQQKRVAAGFLLKYKGITASVLESLIDAAVSVPHPVLIKNTLRWMNSGSFNPWHSKHSVKEMLRGCPGLNLYSENSFGLHIASGLLNEFRFCWYFLLTGRCFKNETGNCSFLHANPFEIDSYLHIGSGVGLVQRYSFPAKLRSKVLGKGKKNFFTKKHDKTKGK